MGYADPRENQVKILRHELEQVTARLRLCTEQLGEKTMEIERLNRRLTELKREQEKTEHTFTRTRTHTLNNDKEAGR